ncbi:MAG: SUMF1/EgtB/PvdO family nonheme iron enzyme, partial [bacterium]|nr:SUMF1/EgtB/PvdO family nonheme iron enzyme [bacterium]
MKWKPGNEICYHYTIERFLGAGGMGEVYHAFHQVTRREVAIKAVREHWKDQSEYPMMLERFSKEATIWTRLPRSPHIVEAIEFFPEFKSDPYLILEFIDGVNLKAFLEREKRIDCLQATRYAIDFCSGMEAAVLEGQPIVHRDISHDNVLIAKAGNTLKVNDFGLAMTGVINPNSQFYVMGKEYFMSPEQRLAYSPEQRAALDARSDIYSFGLMFRWVIFGCPEGVEQPTLGPRGQALGDLFKECLQTDRDDRPSSFAEIRNRLAEHLKRYAGESKVLCRECGYIPWNPGDSCSLCGGALHESVPIVAEETNLPPVSVPVQDPEPVPDFDFGRTTPSGQVYEDVSSPGVASAPAAVPASFLGLDGGSSETGISEATVSVICTSLGIDESRVRHLKESSPQRFVDLPPFAVAKYPVTRAEFQKFLDATGYDRSTNLHFDRTPVRDNHPVTGVSWDDALAYCRWRGDVRLPTSYEWEHAARGGRVQLYPWGNQFDSARCNTTQSGEGQTVPVDHYPESASPCGALQMTGNVWELTDSGSPQHGKIAIGGSYKSDGRWQGATFFNYYLPPGDRDNDDVGFRVVHAPTAADPELHGNWVQIPGGEFWSGCEQVFAETLVRKFGLSSGSIGTLTQYEHLKQTVS